MLKRFLFVFISFIIVPIQVNAQLKAVYDELKRVDFNIQDDSKGWKNNGGASLNINQSIYDKWNGTNNNSIELSIGLNKKLKYQTSKMIWDNYFIADFGLNKLSGQEIRKTQDRLELNSLIGMTLPNHWSASYFLNMQTQLTNSYDYDKDPEKENRINGFLAPLYIATGPGIMWQKNDKLNFNIAPLTCKMTYINGNIYRYDKGTSSFKSNKEISILGVPAGDDIIYQLGFYSSALYEFKLAKNIKVENRLSLYSNYLDNPTNIDVDYTMRMHLGINDLLSTQIIFQARYDDDSYSGIQGRESIGVGLKFKI